jgi:hypothetical protein
MLCLLSQKLPFVADSLRGSGYSRIHYLWQPVLKIASLLRNDDILLITRFSEKSDPVEFNERYSPMTDRVDERLCAHLNLLMNVFLHKSCFPSIQFAKYDRAHACKQSRDDQRNERQKVKMNCISRVG